MSCVAVSFVALVAILKVCMHGGTEELFESFRALLTTPCGDSFFLVVSQAHGARKVTIPPSSVCSGMMKNPSTMESRVTEVAKGMIPARCRSFKRAVLAEANIVCRSTLLSKLL